MHEDLYFVFMPLTASVLKWYTVCLAVSFQGASI